MANKTYRKKQLLIMLPVVTICLLAAFFLSNKEDSLPIARQVNKGNRPPQRIFLVTIDTLRVDHLPLFGYPINTMPFLAALSEKGSLFENSFTAASTTSLAHASLFTSQHVFQHNVRIHKENHRLAEYNDLLPQVLASQGYRTFAVTSCKRQFFPGLRNAFHSVASVHEDRESKYQKGAVTVDKAISLLQTLEEQEKVFMWVHFFDAHSPYQLDSVNPQQVQQLQNKRYQNTAIVDHAQQQLGTSLETVGKLLDTDPQAARKSLKDLYTKYDAELTYVDTQLRKLFRTVENSRTTGDDLWIIVSDHGEGLGNHGFLGHGAKLYNEQLRQLLLFYSSNRDLVHSQRLKNPSHMIDIFPTLLALTGTKSQHQPTNRRLEGTSLKEALQGHHPAQDERLLFAMRRKYGPRERPDALRFTPGKHMAIQDSEYKYLWWESSREELYHLGSDPHEKNSIANTAPHILAKYRKAMQSFLSAKGYSPEAFH